jgi:hypothetical protein
MHQEPCSWQSYTRQLDWGSIVRPESDSCWGDVRPRTVRFVHRGGLQHLVRYVPMIYKMKLTPGSAEYNALSESRDPGWRLTE